MLVDELENSQGAAPKRRVFKGEKVEEFENGN